MGSGPNGIIFKKRLYREPLFFIGRKLCYNVLNILYSDILSYLCK